MHDQPLLLAGLHQAAVGKTFDADDRGIVLRRARGPLFEPEPDQVVLGGAGAPSACRRHAPPRASA